MKLQDMQAIGAQRACREYWIGHLSVPACTGKVQGWERTSKTCRSDVSAHRPASTYLEVR
jgi:hypothetical protein